MNEGTQTKEGYKRNKVPEWQQLQSSMGRFMYYGHWHLGEMEPRVWAMYGLMAQAYYIT